MIMSYNSSSLFFLSQAPYNHDNQHRTSHDDSFFCLFVWLYIFHSDNNEHHICRHLFFGVFEIKES
jgi:hypothetical protein